MVTSASTPGSILMEVTCLIISERRCKSLESLVDPHLKTIPSLKNFTRSISCSDSQSLGRHLNRPFLFEILFLCASDQVSTYLFRRFYVVAGDSNSNLVNHHLRFHGCLPSVFKNHNGSAASDRLVPGESEQWGVRSGSRASKALLYL